jgi:2-polyprenyl-3-methyl-5-hydroxy-6-metoxy-1,4-benzoquinol methylase
VATEQERDAQSFEGRWRSRFEGFANQNDDDAGIAGWSQTGLEARLRNFAHLWRVGENDRLWLDAGCGGGTYTRFLAEHGMVVLGTDYCVSAVQKAKRRDTTRSQWCAADVRKLPVRPGTFDGVLCFGVTQALATSEPAVSELTAAVRPGGEVWIDALNGYCIPHVWERLRRKLQGRPPHVRYESPIRLVRLLKKYGLAETKLFWVPILPGSQQRFQWVVETRVARWMFHHVPLLGALISHAFVLKGKRSC